MTSGNDLQISADPLCKMALQFRCACFIAKRSQNIEWETTFDTKKVGHKLVRRVSIDQFYALVTGQEDAFYQMCMALPEVIKKSVDELSGTVVLHDTVIEELRAIADKQNIGSRDLATVMAVYMLEFGSHKTFIGTKGRNQDE